MADELRKAIKKRTAIKAQLTRFKTYLTGVQEEESILRIQTRLEKAVGLWNNFDIAQTEIEELDGDETDHSNERIAFENAYFDIISQAKQMIEDRTPTEATSVSTRSSSVSETHTQPTMHIKLPTINLPTYYGAYDQWLQFYDTFNSMIHTNTTLSEIQKFHYLRSSLKNEAAQVISSLEITSDNYEIAWRLLKERFENKRLIIHNHVKALFELPTITKESHVTLRQLVDNVIKHLRALQTLQQPTEQWDTLIMYLISTKLDSTTKRDWETSLSETKQMPTLIQMTNFLANKAQVLETMNTSISTNKTPQKITQTNNKFRVNKDSEHTVSYVTTHNTNCKFCKGSHPIYSCEDFLKLSIKSRSNEVKRLKLCINCLRAGHFSKDCRSSQCRRCDKRHNTLLHSDEQVNNDNQQLQDTQNQAENSVVTHCAHKHKSHILLSTALVHILDTHGNKHQCRALLDSGSQSNFITEELLTRLKLPSNKIDLPIIGINQIQMKINRSTHVTVKSMHNGFKSNITCIILPKITENLPTVSIDVSQVNIPDNLKLADPNFHSPSRIDLLLGANLFWDLLCVGQIKRAKHQPVLQKTQLGWIIAGPMTPTCKSSNQHKTVCNLSIDQAVQEQLKRFWEIEEVQQRITYSQEEIECEQHFIRNTTHDANGRFIVSLPLRDEAARLGESREGALQRFYSLERKLAKNPDIKTEYVTFMKEYEDLGHMTLIETEEDEANPAYYMPHHAVLKESSETTKLRVVFDASAKTTSGVSLNDTMMVGPTIQDDLFAIVTRFRTHRYVIAADITKMYRQIYIHDEQRNLQRILWRADTSQEVKSFKLNTVTYGTAAAPFLAIRSLQQVAIENRTQYPISSKVIERDFYVDDLLTGTDSVHDARKLINELVSILKTRGFELRKWNSNNRDILSEIPHSSSSNTQTRMIENQDRKTLGLRWIADSDTLQYSVKLDNDRQQVSKRSILSTIAQIFDPLGLIGPATINAKIILQKLWQLQLDWDESVPLDLHTKWTQFRNQIQVLNDISIPRHIVCLNPARIQIHGFADASEAAYGACIYLRSSDQAGYHTIQLVCAKSRVAPLKRISLPRLELCGAQLLAQLIKRIVEATTIKVDECFYWSDSTVTLAWIAGSPNQWKTFIANRVAEIQELTHHGQWHHVSTRDNPADIISRGINPQQLKDSELWWHGPKWLSYDEQHWPQTQKQILVDIPETRTCTLACTATEVNEIFNKYSSLNKLQRTIAYCLRFKNNSLKQYKLRDTGQLTVRELNYTKMCLLKLMQAQEFSQDLKDLRDTGSVNRNSKLLTLNPFLDENNLIRVGGRLKNSNLQYSAKHPIVIPYKHRLTELIVLHEHQKLLHAGPQTVLSSIRTQYWPLCGLNAIKRVNRTCIKCFRVNPQGTLPQMGDLPRLRVTPSRPFLNCGVDYAGPFLIKEGRTRSRKTVKAYICLFICFATKAIHIELVSELTTSAFLNALKRFTSRRGKSLIIHSDNATNFIGANNELRQIINSQDQKQIERFSSEQGITFKFIPARSPHFGGLWEAAIKSTKSHLKRVIGSATLTFEEFTTLLTQIEACLNSRPLTPLSKDPNDLTALTPGHFLIGDSLTAIPQHNVQNIQTNRLSHYERLQHMFQHFWTRWQHEYLSQLQQRTKWKQDQPNKLQPGTMVVLRDDNLPPLKWQLGRILQLHPGRDGITRVVTIQVQHGVVKRAVTKICILPIET